MSRVVYKAWHSPDMPLCCCSGYMGRAETWVSSENKSWTPRKTREHACKEYMDDETKVMVGSISHNRRGVAHCRVPSGCDRTDCWRYVGRDDDVGNTASLPRVVMYTCVLVLCIKGESGEEGLSSSVRDKGEHGSGERLFLRGCIIS